MSTIVMSVNAGSSSLKFKVYAMPEKEALASGNIERIGLPEGIFGYKVGSEKFEKRQDFADHAIAVQVLMDTLLEHKVVNELSDIKAMGHRMVHGGETFAHSVLVDEQVEAEVEALCDLAPLHNPAALVGLRAFRKALPDAVHSFVFDTAFHQTMPEENYLYPIDYQYYEKDKVRRYGMHGTSHQYLVERLAEIQQKPLDQMNIVTLHLGNGASISAIKNGKCFMTSMGFTPLAGIMMGTRSGDIDPAIALFLGKKYQLSYDELDNVLNKQSGMLGVSGLSSDARDVENAANEGNHHAILTQKMYVRRIVETVSSYIGLMGGADALVFAGGIGENSISMRKAIIEGLAYFGVQLDEQANDVRGQERLISTQDSRLAAWLIPTDEESKIAGDAYEILLNGHVA